MNLPILKNGAQFLAAEEERVNRRIGIKLSERLEDFFAPAHVNEPIVN